MPSDRESLEQELLEQAQQAIRKMLKDLPDPETLTMSDMERLTGEMGHKVMQEAMQKLSDSQQQDFGKAVYCEECKTRMQKRGRRKKRVVTLRGEVAMDRQYYRCPNCGAGHFPPG